MRFYTGNQFPAEYRNQIFIAEHGSWNRSSKSGYRITLVRIENGKAVGYEPFATGWLQGQQAWGRPADVVVAPDGALLVADDTAGAIYRISYQRCALTAVLLSSGASGRSKPRAPAGDRSTGARRSGHRTDTAQRRPVPARNTARAR